MKISDVMTTNVVTLTPDTPLKKAAALMLERGVSGLPVVEEDGVVGVLSETDILFKEHTRPDRQGLVDWVMHYGEDPPEAKLDARLVGEAMTVPAVTVPPGRSVADAATMMLDLGLNRLPVVDGDELVGIVTRSDLVRAFTRTDDAIEREIREDVILHTLWSEPSTILVEVDAGDVVIEGRVDNEQVAKQISAYALRVPGVVSFESKLTWPRPRASRKKRDDAVHA
jgi:CBS domain-containing protein